jgi:hypothetical protein
MKLSNKELHAYALDGAKAQLERIFTLFPGLREGGNHKPSPATSGGSGPSTATPRKRRKMSAAARKKISAMMTARWAERRAGKGAKAAKGAKR